MTTDAVTRSPSRQTLAWAAVAGAAFLGYFLLILYCDVWRPEDPGFTFTDVQVEGEMRVTGVAPGGPAARAGLDVGDRILTWQGRPVNNVDWLLIESYMHIERPIPLEVERNGVLRPIALQLRRASAGYWLTQPGWMLLASRLVQLVSLILAGVVAFRGRGDVVTLLGAWLLATFAIFWVAPPYRLAAVWGALPVAAGAVLWIPFISGLGATAILARFLAVFPRKTIRSRLVFAAVWTPMALVLIKPVAYYVRLVYVPDSVRAHEFGGTPLLVVSAGYLIAGVIVLARNYRRLDDVNERRRVRVMVVGLGAACALGAPVVPTYWQAEVENIGDSVFTSPWMALGTLVLLAIPLSFSYAILKHRMFDLRVIIRQGVRYALARRAILLLAPMFLVALVLEVVVRHGQDEITTVLRTHVWPYLGIGGLIVLARVQRNRWLDAIDRRFFRDRYDAQQLLRRVAEDLHDAGSVEGVAPRLVGQLESAFHAEFSAILVRRPDELRYHPIASAPSGRAPAPLDADTKFAGLLRLLGHPVEVRLPEARWLSKQLPPDEIRLLQAGRIELAVPVVGVPGAAEAILVLGPKRSEEPFTEDDKALLLAIARNLALLLDRSVKTPAPGDAMEECPTCGTCYALGTAQCPDDGAALDTPGTPYVLAGRYRLERRLGEGGMGAVYVAVDEALDRTVAVKLVRQGLASRPEIADRFQQEARAAASFAHPNIATVHDFGTTTGGPYLVMELLEGVTLRDVMRDGPVGPVRTTSILRGVSGALTVAHKRQLVHRDLKPENILLVSSESGEIPKILDFGIAKYQTPTRSRTVTQVATEPGVLLGTPRYMAPEQLKGADAGPESDIWALGVIAFEMLTGMHPLGDIASGSHELLQESSWLDKTIAATDMPANWRTFFVRVLALDPTSRPRSPAAFYASLEELLTPD